MQSKAGSVEQYLAELPEDRREALEALRAVILKNLDKKGYEEGMQYGMIGYYVPHSVFPAGYHCDPRQPLPFASIASQKSHMALYLMCVYSDAENERWLRDAWARSGKKLDMGKSCIRFKKLSDVPLDVVGELIKRVPASRYIESYQAGLASSKGAAKKKPAAAKAEPATEKAATPKKAPAKKAAAKKAIAPKRAAAKKAARRAD
ncbi:DUF1801 domain-containing protein [Polyangium aurulentum]|uniref:DUF1801 domain-containing protein n=1 Tax=Polyangium aurulentum TaxID=2567896 RepID=UPI0010AEB3E5|nr:DUF1801 domain-containing protein [Polyangium aurulentum]UQA54719.1 DUF1801 domain-containing protein [Polyangium aurulentum]